MMPSSISTISPTLRLRRGHAADAHRLSELAQRAFVTAYDGAFPQRDLTDYARKFFNTDALEHELTKPEITWWLAASGDELQGFVKLEPTPAPESVAVYGRAIELARLYIAPEYIGRGMGSHLMQQALDSAHAEGFDFCWLRVWTRNDRAIGFYKRWRFRLFDLEPDHHGRTSTTVFIMGRLLP